MPNNDMFQKQFLNPAPCCLTANYFFNTICFFVDSNILKEKILINPLWIKAHAVSESENQFSF